MTWPAPQPGLVIRYAYLWTSEARTGRDEGVKDRPCAIVLAVAAAQDRKRVIVLPITHTAPLPPDEGIELPLAVKNRLKLDHERSWVVVTEGNDLAIMHLTIPWPLCYRIAYGEFAQPHPERQEPQRGTDPDYGHAAVLNGRGGTRLF